MRIVSVEEMREIEKVAESEFGLNESLIIETVGLRISDYLYEKYLSKKDYGEIVFFAGRGNNASDGYAVCRQLRRYGLKIRAFQLFSAEECSEECINQMRMAEAYGVKTSEVSTNGEIQSYFDQRSRRAFVIDGIFGTGVRLPVSNFLFDVFNLVGAQSEVVISLDMPSGVHGDSGIVAGNAIEADETLAIGMPKLGHLSQKGQGILEN